MVYGLTPLWFWFRHRLSQFRSTKHTTNMSPEESKPDKPNKPPYLSFVTLTNFLKSLDEGVIPSQIDKTLMPGQSGATQSYLLAALSFFNMVDAKGKPTPVLGELLKAKVTGEGAKSVWKKLFDQSYAPILGDLDLATATPGQLLEKFRASDYGGDTLRKCHVFFIAVSEAAGVHLAKHLKVVSKVAAVRKGPKKAAAGYGDSAGDGEQDIEDHGPLPELEGHRIAELPLNGAGDRLVRLQAPTTVSATELERIKGWLAFQLIVEPAPSSSS